MEHIGYATNPSDLDAVFAALADSRIDTLAAEVGAELDPIPIPAPPADPPEGFSAGVR